MSIVCRISGSAMSELTHYLEAGPQVLYKEAPFLTETGLSLFGMNHKVKHFLLVHASVMENCLCSQIKGRCKTRFSMVCSIISESLMPSQS